MAPKRKRVVLSSAIKLKIVEQLRKGGTGEQFVKMYGVGQSTASDVKRSKHTNFLSVLENSAYGSLWSHSGIGLSLTTCNFLMLIRYMAAQKQIKTVNSLF